GGGTGVGGTGVLGGGTGVLVESGTLIGALTLVGAIGGLGPAVGSGAPATGDLLGSGLETDTGVAGPAGLPGAEVFGSLCRSLPPLPLLVPGPSLGNVDGLVTLPGPADGPAGMAVAVLFGDALAVAAGLAPGAAVVSAANSAPLTRGAGVAGGGSVAVGGSAAASVGASDSWLANPDCSAFGSNSDPPCGLGDDPEEPLRPHSGAYGPAGKFVTLGESKSNSPIVTNTTVRQTPTINPIR